MRSFAILTNSEKDPQGLFTDRVLSFLRARGAFAEAGRDVLPLREDTDCVIVLGGDGTVLRAARALLHTRIPLLGINLGTLGYLTETGPDGTEEALERLLTGEYITEERMMLRGQAFRGDRLLFDDTALNDIAVTRFGKLRMMHFMLHVNGKQLTRYNADGLVTATPTGSTGYSLSAGGPIVSPSAKLLIISPIAPHGLGSRSIVLPENDRIEIGIEQDRGGSDETASAYFDGEEAGRLQAGDRIVITKASECTHMIRLSDVSFLETLRQKMQSS